MLVEIRNLKAESTFSIADADGKRYKLMAGFKW
jgi:hypothetical protein